VGITVALQNFVKEKFYTINVANIVILTFTCTNNFALVHEMIITIYEFENVFQLYLMFI
jgi:hypothetical protein